MSRASLPYPLLRSPETHSQQTLKARRLTLRNFTGPFNTHGIDIITDPNDPGFIFIVAVNHLPNPAYYGSPAAPKDSSIPKARSRLELFQHKLYSSEATHIRSIWHPLVRTPNDVLSKSLDEIYVTNDHYHREGPLRLLEEVSYGSVGQSTDLIHLHLTNPLAPVEADTTGVTGNVANIIDMNNGLGHGRTPEEIMVVRASIGQLLLAHVDETHPPKLSIDETIQLPSTLDNPSYFSDPYAEITRRDASGYVLAGLARAITFPLGSETTPVMVWLVQPNGAIGSDSWKGKKAREKWSTRLIFQDDGRTLRTASTAVLVAVNPDKNDGRKQAYLFVTGPLAKGVVVTKVDI